MKFTLEAYEELINLLKKQDFKFINYHKKDEKNKKVILRHDVDFSLDKALEIAKLESKLNVTSTFFVLLSTNFYNVFSKESYNILREILKYGQEIGLHFDEVKYNIENAKELEECVEYERKILGEAIGSEVKSVSMHRPSKWILKNDIKLNNCVNSYSKQFFQEFKYVSDSRMNWREDVISIIKQGDYDNLHILTHPFWYSKKEETMEEKLFDFIECAKDERVINLKENFTDLNSVIKKDVSK